MVGIRVIFAIRLKMKTEDRKEDLSVRLGKTAWKKELSLTVGGIGKTSKLS